MRLKCPVCGERDRREFYYRGAAVARPTAEAPLEAWDEYVHLRDNPAGPTRELWLHEGGCGAWLVVTRDTVTHEVLDAVLAEEGV
ncbi:sarcosine oxidase subunit delta [Roseobacteraceae bacterium S113]